MTRREFKGGAAPLTLSGNIAASGVTTINTTGSVAAWPTGAIGKFLIVIDRGLAGEEKLYCLTRSGNNLTVANDGDRGADGTTASSHVSGAAIAHCGGAIDLDEPNQHINSTTEDDHTQYLLVDGSRAPTGISVLADVPSAVGYANAKGSGPALAANDHIHASLPRLGGVTQKTSSYSLTSSTTDVTGLAVTLTTVVGRTYKVTLYAPVTTGVSTLVTISLQEGATVLASGVVNNTDAGSGITPWPVTLTAILTPSAASHTYKATGLYNGSASSVAASATNPAFILVEDIT